MNAAKNFILDLTLSQGGECFFFTDHLKPPCYIFLIVAHSVVSVTMKRCALVK